MESGSKPANIAPGGEGKIVVTATDLGDADSNGGTGSPVRIVDTLPPGLKATGIVANVNAGDGIDVGNKSVGSCTETPVLGCEYTEDLADYNGIQVVISVKAEPGAQSGELNHATVSGGGAPRAVSATHPITISSAPRRTVSKTMK